MSSICSSTLKPRTIQCSYQLAMAASSAPNCGAQAGDRGCVVERVDVGDDLVLEVADARAEAGVARQQGPARGRVSSRYSTIAID